MPIGWVLATLACLPALLQPAPSGPAAPAPPRNLALDATPTASEVYEQFTPEKACDGDRATRWSGIPGHNSGVWYQLEWPQPVHLGEIVIHQFDRFTFDMDVQAWDEHAGDWRTLQHFGVSGKRLPSVVVCRFAPLDTARIRVANITNGPSFTEVEAYADPFTGGITTRLASDLRGNLIGIVTDGFGASGVPDATVTFSGRVAHRPGGQETWGASATSDASGQFAVPMPLGLTGPVQITTTAGTAKTQTTADACEFQYGLTARGLDGIAKALSETWRFLPDPPAGFEQPGFDDSSWAKIDVPAHWEMQGFHPTDGVGGYRARFSARAGDGRVKLAFDGVYSGAQVWVNGTPVAVHEGGATPFECDITDALRSGDNTLALRVTEHTTTSDLLDQMSSYADFPLGGIFRKVWLLRVPAAHIGSLALQTDFDDQSRNAMLTGIVTILNESDKPLSAGSLRFRLTDPDGKKLDLNIPPVEIRAKAWERADAPVSIRVPSPRTWDAEHPNLYTLTVELRSEDDTVQKLQQRVGFRQTLVRGPQLLINGKPVKIRGTCHHDSHPLMGRAVTPELTRQDLTLIKEANMNSVRTSHYPPIPELLDIADELGLYVEDEASFCWVGVSDDLRNAPRILQLTAELLARDRNHPSVFMWSLCNESQFGRSFELSRDWVRAADPSRPLAAATSEWLDLATLHNPMSVAGIDQQEQLDRPLLWDESLAPFQGIWGDAYEIWLDPGIRDYYAVPLIAAYDRMMKSRAVQGSQIWAWSDDIFCVPGRGLEYGRRGTRTYFIEEQYAIAGRGLAGDAPWGLVDGWRRLKPEYWIIKKIHSPVRVAEKPIEPPPAGAEIRIPIENQYDFTDLSELKITWKTADDKGTATIVGTANPLAQTKSSIPARTTGEVRFTPRRAPAPGDAISLTFTDAADLVVDQVKIPVGKVRIDLPPGKPPEPRPLLIREESTLAGHATRVIGGEFELAIDRDSGRLRRCVAFGEPLMVEVPSIHLLQFGRPLAAVPDRTGWHVQQTEVVAEGENVHVRIAGTYGAFAGRYDLVITPGGEITVTASFDYSGPDLWAREVGLRLALPRTCDALEWSRRGEWAVYPEDHIGRPRGSATAVADHSAKVPPRWAWGLDNSPLGSADFRSTKRHIDWASLQCPSGAAVQVISDGTQHSRATLETDRIAWFVNDWYGGTGSGLGEWEGNYGKGRLVKTGEHIESTVRLRLVRMPR